MSEISRLARPEIVAMEAYSSARSESADVDVSVFLDANESPFAMFPDAGAPPSNRYPSQQPRELRRLLAECYDVEPEFLLVTRGAVESIDVLIRTFCTAGRDGVLITPPMYGMYETAAHIQNALLHRVPLRRDHGFQLDVSQMLAQARSLPNLKLVFVCSPNNPTGNLLREEDVFHLASELSGKALVIADQAYVDFAPGGELTEGIQKYSNLVILRTLSKAYALAGERCGATIAHPEIIGLLGKVLAPYPLAISAIATILRAMTPEYRARVQQDVQLILQERARVEEALRSSPVVDRVYPSDANYILFETSHAPALFATMLRNGIRLRDRSVDFGVLGAIRCTIGTPAQNDRMLEVLRRYELTLKRECSVA